MSGYWRRAFRKPFAEFWNRRDGSIENPRSLRDTNPAGRIKNKSLWASERTSCELPLPGGFWASYGERVFRQYRANYS
jgi:hypothetical protein